MWVHHPDLSISLNLQSMPFFSGGSQNCYSQQLTLCASCSTPRATGSRVRANLVKGDTRMSDVAASCRGPACRFMVTSSRVLLPYIAYPATPAERHQVAYAFCHTKLHLTRRTACHPGSFFQGCMAKQQTRCSTCMHSFLASVLVVLM